MTTGTAAQAVVHALRKGDRQRVQAIATQGDIDVWYVTTRLLGGYLQLRHRTPPVAGLGLPGAQELARLAAGRPEAAALPKVVAMYAEMDDARRHDAYTLYEALARMRAAFRKRRYEDALAIADDVAEVRARCPWSVHGVLMDIRRGMALSMRPEREPVEAAFLAGATAAHAMGWSVREGCGLCRAASTASRFNDIPIAVERMERGMALLRAAGQASNVAFFERDQAVIYLKANRYEDARRVALRVLAFAQHEKDPFHVARAQGLVGSAYFGLGEFGTAATWHQKAAAGFTRAGERQGALEMLGLLGADYGNGCRYADALRTLEETLGRMDARTADYLRVAAEYNLAVIRAHLGQWGEARPHLERAAALARTAKLWRSEAHAESMTAELLRYEGDAKAAVEHARRALAAWRTRGERHEEGLELTILADTLWDMGKPAEALEKARSAREILTALGDTRAAMRARRVEASALIASGQDDDALRLLDEVVGWGRSHGDPAEADWRALEWHGWLLARRERMSEAVASFREAMEARSQMVRGLGTDEALAFGGSVRDVADTAVAAVGNAAREGPLPAEVLEAGFEFAERARARVLATHLANPDALLQAVLSPELLAQDRRTRERVVAARRRLLELHRAGGGPGLAAAQSALEDAWRNRRELVARIQRESLGAAQVVYPRPSAVAEVRAELPADAALLLYHVTEGVAYAIVVRPEATAWVNLGDAPSLLTAARGWLRFLSADGSPESALARELHRRLIRPLRKHLGGTKRLLVVPDDVLSFLPFGALLDTGGDRPRRLIEQFELAMLPSASVYVSLEHAQAGRTQGRGLLALGAPDYAHGPTAGIFPPLPGSEAEVRAAAALWPEDERRVLLGPQATAQGLRDALAAREGRVAVLHLACHAVVDSKRPARSGLALTGGLLELDALYRTPLPVDLAVLSACRTASGSIVSGEGALGFVHAFLRAGAARVVASTWSVSDDSTRRLMERFHQALRKDGLAPAAALRRAELQEMQGPTGPVHPYHWAAFALWGLPD